jgi:hypothetical protein
MTMASSSDFLCNIENKRERDRLRIARKQANPVYRDAERARKAGNARKRERDRQRMARK